jgi:MinD-like ATPase involved in chromosome partitioning or flagellar assembly
VGLDADKGLPFVISRADSESAKTFMDIVEKVEGYLEEREKLVKPKA